MLWSFKFFQFLSKLILFKNIIFWNLSGSIIVTKILSCLNFIERRQILDHACISQCLESGAHASLLVSRSKSLYPQFANEHSVHAGTSATPTNEQPGGYGGCTQTNHLPRRRCLLQLCQPEPSEPKLEPTNRALFWVNSWKQSHGSILRQNPGNGSQSELHIPSVSASTPQHRSLEFISKHFGPIKCLAWNEPIASCQFQFWPIMLLSAGGEYQPIKFTNCQRAISSGGQSI